MIGLLLRHRNPVPSLGGANRPELGVLYKAGPTGFDPVFALPTQADCGPDRSGAIVYGGHFVNRKEEILRRLIVITCLVGSFLVIGFTGGGEASTTHGHAAAATVPLKIFRGRGGVAALALVRIHGRLFPFIIDTGSQTTLVNVALARQLHLKTVGKPINVTGVGCSETARRVRLSNWSIGGQRLPRITAISSTIAGIGVPAGLLGADVLAHFGAIGIDFAHGVLTLG